MTFSYWTQGSHDTIAFYQDTADHGGRMPFPRLYFPHRKARRKRWRERDDADPASAAPLPGRPRPVARRALRRNGFVCHIVDSTDSYGKKTSWETKIVTSRNYLPANVTNIVV